MGQGYSTKKGQKLLLFTITPIDFSEGVDKRISRSEAS